MASISYKGSCVLFLVLMVLTEGAKIPGAGDHTKHKTSLEQDDMVPLQLNPQALAPMRPVRALYNSSISPWTYNTTHDSSLFPPHISEARCLLQGCLNSSGQEDLQLESRPIMHQIMLLRRVRSPLGQAYHYRLESRLIAVGCTCVKVVVQKHH